VSIHKLKTYLARVQKRRSRPAETELAESLVDSLYVLAKYSDYSEHRHPPTSRSHGWFIRLLFLSSELNISIVALVEGFKILPRDFITKSTTGDSIWPTSRIHNGTALRRLFLSAGWCEDMATRIIRTYTFQTAYYLYMLVPPISHFHHGNCAENVCRRSIIDEKSYVVRHESLTDDGKCDTCAQNSCEDPFLRSTLRSDPALDSPFVAMSTPAMNLSSWGPSASDLDDILRLDDKFPVIIVLSHPESTEGLKLRVVAHDSPECSGYIAFSHVWSNGRGNPSINRVPLCQLVRLDRLASQGRETTNSYGAFWIDTLCVPVT
jgi:hypothetical protein